MKVDYSAGTLPTDDTPPGAERSRLRVDARRWVFVLVPAIGLLELCAHVREANSAVPESDWIAAREAVKAMVTPDDLVVFAPRWADPIGRRYFRDAVATIDREAREDDTRFSRAFEVSIRGLHAPELASWKSEGSRRIGAITITTLVNPSPQKVIDDLLAHDNAEGMRVARVLGGVEQDCGFAHLSAQTGGLGFGPAVPADRFNCPGGTFVGITVVADLDYVPHRCFYAKPLGGTALLRARFTGVVFGNVLHGHHGLYVEAERNRDGAPVTLTFRVGDRVIGHLTHNDGDGWKGFELPTTDLAGQTGDLIAEVSAPNDNRRMYCFEADTR